MCRKLCRRSNSNPTTFSKLVDLLPQEQIDSCFDVAIDKTLLSDLAGLDWSTHIYVQLKVQLCTATQDTNHKCERPNTQRT